MHEKTTCYQAGTSRGRTPIPEEPQQRFLKDLLYGPWGVTKADALGQFKQKHIFPKFRCVTCERRQPLPGAPTFGVH